VKPAGTFIEDAWHQLLTATPPLPVDQAIVYRRPRGNGWIHVSHTNRHAPRREFLVESGGDYVPWAEWGDRPLVSS
jgi:hypothetical protein